VKHQEAIAQVSTQAVQEAALEELFTKKVQLIWATLEFTLNSYKESKDVFILGSVEDVTVRSCHIPLASQSSSSTLPSLSLLTVANVAVVVSVTHVSSSTLPSLSLLTVVVSVIVTVAVVVSVTHVSSSMFSRVIVDVDTSVTPLMHAFSSLPSCVRRSRWTTRSSR
jgi:hypothetical protein